MDLDALTGCLVTSACLVTQATSGLIIGMLLFLVAVGLTLIFGVLKVVNFSHGAFYMFGAYFAMTTYQYTGSFALAMLAGAIGTAIMLLAEASKKANSADGKKIAEALRGLKIKSPFGADGTVTMRAEDQTLIGYAIGWGTTIPQEPYVPEVKAGDWKTILELEAEWKKSKGYT